MSTELTIKKGRGVPKAADLAEAELALDIDVGTLYSKLSDGTITALNDSGGTGAGMVIQPTEPTEDERVTGLQWLDSTTGRVWIWDDGRWLEFPANVPAGEEYDDTELRALISDEESARQLADEALQDQIDNLDIPEVGSGLIEVSEEPPEPPYEIGQQWFSSTDGYLYLWYGSEWVAIGGASGGAP